MGRLFTTECTYLPTQCTYLPTYLCRKQGKKGIHDTRCMNRLGLFITRRRDILNA